MSDVPESSEKPESRPFWVICDDCRHTWSPLALPMEAGKAVKIMMLHNKCPNCGSKKVMVAKQGNGKLMEGKLFEAEPANG